MQYDYSEIFRAIFLEVDTNQAPISHFCISASEGRGDNTVPIIINFEIYSKNAFFQFAPQKIWMNFSSNQA